VFAEKRDDHAITEKLQFGLLEHDHRGLSSKTLLALKVAQSSEAMGAISQINAPRLDNLNTNE